MVAVLPSNFKITSEFLASSVGSNPVEIRKLLSSLKKAEIIDVTRGPGGVTLKKEPKDITLLDIYNAVDSASLDELIGVHNHPSQRCLFGKNISRLLAEPYSEVSEVIRQKMASITLERLLVRLQEIVPAIYEHFSDKYKAEKAGQDNIQIVK